MKKIISRLLDATPIVVAGMFTLVVTGYVFANSYEVVTLEDLPSIPSISQFDVPSIQELYSKSTDIENYRWDTMKFSSFDNNLAVVRAIESDGRLYQQASKGHYFFMNEDPIHIAGDTFVYLTKSWRTIYEPEIITAGEIIKVENQSNLYTYRVTETLVSTTDEDLILSEDPRINLMVVILDPESKTIHYINSIQISDEKKI